MASSRAAPSEDGPVHLVTSEQARTQFSELFSRVAFSAERFIVTRHGKALAAVIPVEEFALLDQLKRRIEDFVDHQAVREAKERQGRQPPATPETVREALGLDGPG